MFVRTRPVIPGLFRDNAAVRAAHLCATTTFARNRSDVEPRFRPAALDANWPFSTGQRHSGQAPPKARSPTDAAFSVMLALAASMHVLNTAWHR
jgi:hypothetical protein